MLCFFMRYPSRWDQLTGFFTMPMLYLRPLERLTSAAVTASRLLIKTAQHNKKQASKEACLFIVALLDLHFRRENVDPIGITCFSFCARFF